jgi:hypothetical protein
MNERARSAKRRLLQRDRKTSAPANRSVVSLLDALRPVTGQQQDLIECVIACEFIDQHIEKWPPADFKHRLGYSPGAFAEPGAETADQDGGLP